MGVQRIRLREEKDEERDEERRGEESLETGNRKEKGEELQ